MNFKTWVEQNNDPRVQQAWAKYIKPVMIVYRGLRLCPDSANKKIRQILMTPFKQYPFDHWTISFNVAASAGRGVGMWTDGANRGTSCSLQETFHIIIEAQITPNDIDKNEFARVVTGTGVNKGAGIDSYFEQELEIPVLKSSYPALKLTAYYLKLPQTQWIKETNRPISQALAALKQ